MKLSASRISHELRRSIDAETTNSTSTVKIVATAILVITMNMQTVFDESFYQDGDDASIKAVSILMPVARNGVLVVAVDDDDDCDDVCGDGGDCEEFDDDCDDGCDDDECDDDDVDDDEGDDDDDGGDGDDCEDFDDDCDDK